MLKTMAGCDRVDITSVEHPKEDNVADMRQPVQRLSSGEYARLVRHLAA